MPITSVQLSDGARLRVRVKGSGPAVLLLRPLGGTLELWGTFADALALRHTVIAFDTRGTGGSSALRGPITTRRLARDARELIEHLAVARASVFGQSLGGMVATWLAIDAPSRVDRLVLASTAASGASFTHAGIWRGLGFTRCMLQRPEDVETCLAKRVLSNATATDPQRMREIAGELRARPTSRRTLALLGLAGAMHMPGARVREIRSRTLCLAGEHDDLLGASPQRSLAAAIPGAQFDTIDGAAHDITLDAPTAGASRVLAFLGEQ